MNVKILIVEDEKLLGEMYLDKFKKEKFTTFLARDAKEGLELAKKRKPHLVLLDMLLPRENGIFFLRQLRADEETASIPTVVFSNLDDPEMKKEAIALGALDYLIKTSYTPFKIVEKTRSLLGIISKIKPNKKKTNAKKNFRKRGKK